eukprot:14363944-Alexandrium_andersonii.AAC.1
MHCSLPDMPWRIAISVNKTRAWATVSQGMAAMVRESLNPTASHCRGLRTPSARVRRSRRANGPLEPPTGGPRDPTPN